MSECMQAGMMVRLNVSLPGREVRSGVMNAQREAYVCLIQSVFDDVDLITINSMHSALWKSICHRDTGIIYFESITWNIRNAFALKAFFSAQRRQCWFKGSTYQKILIKMGIPVLKIE